MVLLNFYNQQGAGPAVITGQFLNHLPDSDNVFVILSETHRKFTEKYQNVRFVIFPTGNFFLKFFVRSLCIPSLLFWLSVRYNVAKYIAFGNFSLLPIGKRKVVLVHHPYLFNISEILKLPIKGRLLELLKYILFRIQILFKRNGDIYVVQSEYMRNLFEDSIKKVFPVVIPNPLRKEFSDINSDDIFDTSVPSSDNISLAYISRFYPHKNHVLLFDLIKSFRKRDVQVTLYVTINENIDSAETFLSQLDEYPEIVNVGEIGHVQLTEIYRKVDATIFLSDIETFGNPIIESLAFMKPVLGVDKEYLKTLTPPILHDFFSNDPNELSINIVKLFDNHSLYKEVSSEISEMNNKVLKPAQWVSRYIEL